MIGINQLRWMSAQPRVVQPDRQKIKEAIRHV